MKIQKLKNNRTFALNMSKDEFRVLANICGLVAGTNLKNRKITDSIYYHFQSMFGDGDYKSGGVYYGKSGEINLD